MCHYSPYFIYIVVIIASLDSDETVKLWGIDVNSETV